jgi:hypothetical protein
LIAPVASRLLSIFVPGLTIRSVEEIPRFAYALQLSQALVVVAALWLWSADRRVGRPFLILAVIAVLQSLSFETIGNSNDWKNMAESFATVPPALAALLGIALGAAVIGVAWYRPSDRSRILAS